MALNVNTLAGSTRMKKRKSSAPGGTQGRAKTMHNGTTGTKRGGKNAMGTPKKNPGHGFFQYGTDQYGFMNPHGAIDWEADKLKFDQWVKHTQGVPYGQVVANAKARGIKVPTSEAPPPYYADWIYGRDMLQPDLQRDQSLAQNELQLKDVAREYDDWMRGANENVRQARLSTAAQMGAAGFNPAQGAGATPLVDIDRQHVSDIEMRQRQKDALESQLKLAMQQSNQQYDITDQVSQIDAKRRFKESGKTPPKRKKGAWQDSKTGQWYYTNPKTGATVTAKPKKKKKGKK